MQPYNPYAAPGQPQWAQRPTGPRPGMGHVYTNATILGVLWFVHLFFSIGVVAELAKGTFWSAGVGTPSTDPARALGEQVGHWIAITVIPTWAASGLVWIPLNVYGLLRLKSWGRTSTMVYWVTSVLTCCSSLFGLYGLVSLMRDEVKELFRADAGRVS